VRPTAVQRHHTDQGLSDVFSDSCRDARNLAELQNQELFQLPRSVMRSRSGMVVSGLKGRRDSRIFNRRSCGGPPAALSSSSANLTPTSMEKKAKQNKERPSSVMVSTQSWFGEDSTLHSTSSLQAPSLTTLSPEEDQIHTAPPAMTSTLCASGVTSNAELALGTPTELGPSPLGSPYIHVDQLTASSESIQDVDKDYRPKRSKSMVDNVKSFFTGSSKRLSRHPPTEAVSSADDLPSARVRSRSTPTSSPHDPLEHSLPSVTVHPVDAETPAPDGSCQPPPTGKGGPVDDLRRKRSFFVYGRRHGTNISRLSAMSTVSATSSTTETSGSNSPIRRRSVKDILLHFRNG